jgi:hypothetical protein
LTEESEPESRCNDAEWLRALVERSALLPDDCVRRHWQRLVDVLPAAARYELADILLDVERMCQS